jgi:hypothetical protein
MEPQELKSLVESGAYKPDPGLIAEAMLDRQGVRELLMGIQPMAVQGGQNLEPSAAIHPRAA